MHTPPCQAAHIDAVSKCTDAHKIFVQNLFKNILLLLLLPAVFVLWISRGIQARITKYSGATKTTTATTTNTKQWNPTTFAKTRFPRVRIKYLKKKNTTLLLTFVVVVIVVAALVAYCRGLCCTMEQLPLLNLAPSKKSKAKNWFHSFSLLLHFSHTP